jgi:CSLREA domain-containing protein
MARQSFPAAHSRAGLMVLAAVVAAPLALLVTAVPVGSQGDLVVTKTADTADGDCDRDCSLREAVIAANLNPGGNDFITVPAGTYRLTLDPVGPDDSAAEGDLDVIETLGIAGAGARRTIIDASALDPEGRVFDFDPEDGFGFLELQKMTITGGDAGAEEGGGVRAAEELDLFGVRLRDNRAFAGGGAFVEGRLIMGGTTVSGNIATGATNRVGGDGGGLLIAGDAEIANSTISGNEVLRTSDRGAGIALASEATLEAEFVTIADNQSAAHAQAAVAGSAQTTATFVNSLLANAPTADCLTSLPVVPRAFNPGNNLSSDATCEFTEGAGDLVGVDPKLGPLRNNGGPTDTHALLRGSPALNAGTFVGRPPSDQRGVKRPQGSAVDIGAYEKKRRR